MVLIVFEIQDSYFNIHINFIKGDSKDVLPLITDTFDLFHIDATHLADNVKNEFNECLNKIHNKTTYFVIDDYDNYPQIVQSFVEENNKYKVIESVLPGCPWRNFMFNIEKY